jgi:hypothetical protein
LEVTPSHAPDAGATTRTGDVPRRPGFFSPSTCRVDAHAPRDLCATPHSCDEPHASTSRARRDRCNTTPSRPIPHMHTGCKRSEWKWQPRSRPREGDDESSTRMRSAGSPAGCWLRYSRARWCRSLKRGATGASATRAANGKVTACRTIARGQHVLRTSLERGGGGSAGIHRAACFLGATLANAASGRASPTTTRTPITRSFRSPRMTTITACTRFRHPAWCASSEVQTGTCVREYSTAIRAGLRLRGRGRRLLRTVPANDDRGYDDRGYDDEWLRRRGYDRGDDQGEDWDE